MSDKQKDSGTVAVGIALLVIVALIILSIVRYFWVDSANKHYDTLIRAYIHENPNRQAEDAGDLRRQLLEEGTFIKMYRWDRESFVKDKRLYQEMLRAYEELLRKQEDAAGGVMDALINL
jgi:hypothetical protein